MDFCKLWSFNTENTRMKAIIYMPGLGTSFTDQSLATFSNRYAKALDINDPQEQKKFQIKFREEQFGIDGSLTTKIAAIHEEVNGKTNHIIDIYEFNYTNELTQSFKQKNVLLKIFSLTAIILINFPKIVLRAIFSIFKKVGGVSEASPFQFIYAGLILLLLAFFGLLLVASFPVTLGSMVPAESLPEFNNFLENYWMGNRVQDIYDLLRNKAKYIIGFFALFYLVVPDLKLFVIEMATEFICIIRYFSTGRNRLNLTGKFEELLEKVSEENNKYENVSVMAYSFGSVIALDTIFPMKGATSFRVSNKITELVTIGCPFDFINLYWRSYFGHREYQSNTIANWFNVYSTTDILSSNFRKDGKEADAQHSVSTKGIVPTNIPFNVLSKQHYNPFRVLMLSGLRAHGMYWEEQVNSASCFTSLVAHQQQITE